MANRFRDPSLRQMYDSCLKLARAGRGTGARSEFYLETGHQRRGAGHRNAFWNGYNGLPNRTFPRDSLAYAAYRAGQDFAKEHERESK